MLSFFRKKCVLVKIKVVFRKEQDMKKLIIICAALLLALPAVASVYLGNSDYTSPFTTDTYTRALWHFDE